MKKCLYFPITLLPEIDAAIFSLASDTLAVQSFDSLEDLHQKCSTLKVPSALVNFGSLHYDIDLSVVELSHQHLLDRGFALPLPLIDRSHFLTRFQIIKDRRVILYLLDGHRDPVVQRSHIEQLLALPDDKNIHVLVKYPYGVGADNLALNLPSHERLTLDGEWYKALHAHTAPSLSLKDALTHADMVIHGCVPFTSACLVNALDVSNKTVLDQTDIGHILNEKTKFHPLPISDDLNQIIAHLDFKTPSVSTSCENGALGFFESEVDAPSFRFYTSQGRVEPKNTVLLMGGFVARTVIRRAKKLMRKVR